MLSRRLGAVVLLVCAACSDDEKKDGGSDPDGGDSAGGRNSGGDSPGGGRASGGEGTAGRGSGGRTSSGGASPGGGAGGANPANGGSSAGGGSSTGGASAGPLDCDPLPIPATNTVQVGPGDAASLSQTVYDAAAGTTILLADGTYTLTATLQIHAEGVTLRGESGDSSKVVLDAAYAVNEAIQVTASRVTVAHLTIEHAVDHPIHATTPGAEDVTDLVFHDLNLRDSGEQFLKVNPGGGGGYVDRGTVTCSRFTMTDAGRPHVEPCCGGCYTGGIDAHAAQGWVVRGNRFEGLYCTAGLAEHAVHFWKGARDTVVENNVILDCARGVGFGLDGGTGDRVYPDLPGNAPKLAHYDGIIRNNVIWADIPYFDTGIELHIASRPLVLNNTVVHGAGATGFFSSIDTRFPESQALLQNNLVARLTDRDSAVSTRVTNLESAPLDLFVDAAGHDFHLAPSAAAAIDQGTSHAESGVDLDGDPHGASPDIGADER